MKNMDKGLTVPKWVVINQPKIPQMPPKFSAPKFEIFEKRSLWVSIVRVSIHEQALSDIQRLLTSYNVT